MIGDLADVIEDVGTLTRMSGEFPAPAPEFSAKRGKW